MKDPICGMEVTQDTSVGSHNYQGETFHFCSEYCLEMFKGSPEKFVQPTTNEDQIGREKPVKSMVDEEVQTHLDPICGMTVREDKAAGTFDHEGETYYFCSTHCLDKFQENPEQYLMKSSEPETTDELPAAKKGIYICPMDPDVQQDGPGACPKCGMALEPLAPVVPETKLEYVCPMHPEIVRGEPGDCPICGMALESRTVTLEEDENPELRDMSRRFWVSLALSIPVFFVAMSELIPGQPLLRVFSKPVLIWLQLVLATPVVLWGGLPFFQRGWLPLSIEV